ncbi:hypothetical protein niasHS_004506 [Heterodera schachtii]|uniref:Uncharacterized protein n=1 Tax=Heterodera schachtii TaxID=97005 RepID=A0ABD2JMC9_HETSC
MRSFFFASLALVLICASTTVSKPHPTVPVQVEPAVPEVEPAVPEVEPAVPEVEPAVPEVEPAVPEVEPAVPSVKTNEKGCYKLCFVVLCIDICPKAKNDENGAAVKWLNISVPIPDAISLPSFDLTNITKGEETEE